MQFVTVHTSFSAADADITRSRLEAADFHPVMENEFSAMNVGAYGAGGIQIQVPPDEEKEAREFLASPQSADEP